jgi:protein SCO1/2
VREGCASDLPIKECNVTCLQDVGRLTGLLCALALGGLASGAVAHDMSAMTADPHAAHHHHIAPDTKRSVAEYAVPPVQLMRADGRSVVLTKALDDGRPVVLNFIYTSCTTICPITSQTFADLQDKLGASRDRVHLVSISIDPEQDTPARLAQYAERFGAGPEWQFYTGSLAASVAAQRAFNVYRGDKMDHAPVALVRRAPGAPWVRIEGFATADQLLGELRDAVAAK